MELAGDYVLFAIKQIFQRVWWRQLQRWYVRTCFAVGDSSRHFEAAMGSVDFRGPSTALLRHNQPPEFVHLKSKTRRVQKTGLRLQVISPFYWVLYCIALILGSISPKMQRHCKQCQVVFIWYSKNISITLTASWQALSHLGASEKWLRHQITL